MNSKIRRQMKTRTGFGQRGWMCMGRTKRKTRCGWGQDKEKDNVRTDTVATTQRNIPMGRGKR